MANIPFNWFTIVNGVSQVSSAALQTLLDAVRMIVDKSQRSTYVLEANTVPEAGIGSAIAVTDFNAINFTSMVMGSPTFFYTGFNPSNKPGTNNYFTGFYQKASTILGTNTGYITAFDNAGSCYTKSVVNGSYGVWQCNNDASNGGQPPAPRPTSGTPAGGANGVGQKLTGLVAGGNTLYYSGNSNLTGTWEITELEYVTASKLVADFGGYTGSGTLYSVPAANTIKYNTTRIA